MENLKEDMKLNQLAVMDLSKIKKPIEMGIVINLTTKKFKTNKEKHNALNEIFRYNSLNSVKHQLHAK